MRDSDAKEAALREGGLSYELEPGKTYIDGRGQTFRVISNRHRTADAVVAMNLVTGKTTYFTGNGRAMRGRRTKTGVRHIVAEYDPTNSGHVLAAGMAKIRHINPNPVGRPRTIPEGRPKSTKTPPIDRLRAALLSGEIGSCGAVTLGQIDRVLRHKWNSPDEVREMMAELGWPHQTRLERPLPGQGKALVYHLIPLAPEELYVLVQGG